MSTLHAVELGVLGPLQVRRDGAPVPIPGAKPRAILTMLGLHGSSIVSAETLLELLWGDDPPRTAAKALQTHISALRRTLDDGFVLTEGMGWVLTKSDTDAARYKTATKMGRDAAAAGDSIQAVARFDEALTLWRGIPELPDTRRGLSEKTRWIEGHAALVEDRADALLATGRAAEIIGELEAAVSDAPLRERRWGQLMLALYRAGRQGEALAAFQRARSLLADELGVDPGPELRRLEAAIVSQDVSLEVTVGQELTTVTRAVTFLLTDIEGSTAAWEVDADAMAVALARHDELAEQVVTSRGGRLIKTRGEGDATFSVFDRPSAAAAAALELLDAIAHEPWALREPMRIRIALHTGEVELRDGDYFGRAVNRAARLRSLAVGGQILCSGATAELAIDSLPDDVVFDDLGMRQLKNLARPEHVFELRLEATDDSAAEEVVDVPLERPGLPAVLIGPGPFVGRSHELEGLVSVWETARTGGMHTVLIAGEPGVGKTRLAGEWSQRAYQQGAVVLYGRCDEDLGAPYQPFAEALRSLVPCIGATRLRGLRGVEALLALVPALSDVLPDLAAPTRADPDTERYALFDAVVALLEVASTSAPVVVVLDDLHWAAKPTLLLLRHLLRFGDQARVQIIGTYRSTDLDRSHPLAAMLADLHRSTDSGTANRLQLSGLDEGDVTAYVTEAGYDDEELARALASVTGGNPFFLIEALRHVDESGGVWDPTTLPQGVRETVSRRLSRLSPETNKALAAAAVVGSRFAVDLVERVVDDDLVDAFDEACKAGILIEEPGGRYRFNHAIVRRSLLAELASVRRMRLHQRIAVTLETEPGADDELLAELAHHYFECAWAGNAAKAVEYCRRAADQAMARLGYEGAAELYDRALHALEELDDELPDRSDQAAELLVARCEALLAAGDVTSAGGAVSQLQAGTVDSARLAAWATCFDGELSMLIHPERLDEVETALDAAAEKLAELDDAAGEAKAHTVRATCLARLGRIGDCEIALDQALTAARRVREHRRVNAVLAGAPLAALWGPNPVPRAGGRCLDVVRLLRITTDSPAVEATSTRCQAVLEAFRGRGAAARRMIDSARRTVTDLGLRHALLEVEQFAGIVELVIDDPTAAEPPLRKAYNGFRRMGLDADTAETAALLGRACLLLDRDNEAGELCTESERLAGHALKPSIAWRTLRAQLLSRGNDHDEARRMAEAAVSLAERTDALVDHGDACLALATVLATAGDVSGARAAVERAVGLWERKGAAALVEKARLVLDDRVAPTAPLRTAPPEAPVAEVDNACARVGQRVIAAIHSESWDVVEELYAPEALVESRRKIVGFKQSDLPSAEWVRQSRRAVEKDHLRFKQVFIAVRGERLALARVVTGDADVSPGAPRDEFLSLLGLDDSGRIALQIWFDIDDIDAAIAELDAAHPRFEQQQPKPRQLENAASQVTERHSAHFAARDWDALAKVLADDVLTDDRRKAVNAGIRCGRDAEIANMQAVAEVGITHSAFVVIAARGERLILIRASMGGGGPAEFATDALSVVEVNSRSQIAAIVIFDLDDFHSAITELDARYVAGEDANHARIWSVVTSSFATFNRHEILAADWVTIDHRRATPFESSNMTTSIHRIWDLTPDLNIHIETVHRLNNSGAVISHEGRGTSQDGFDAEWRAIDLLMVEGDLITRCEIFDEVDLDAALARFDQLSRAAPRLENTATRVQERVFSSIAVGDWDAVAQTTAANVSVDDRRRVVNAGVLHGRDANIESTHATVDVGFTMTMVGAIATRGEHLALLRVRVSGRDPETIQNDALNIVEIDADERIAGNVVFDLNDFEAAIADLDARYLAGEGAAHARTWSVIAGFFAAHNRREVAATTPDVVTIDHRRAAAFAPGEGIEYIRAGWELDQSLNIYIETAHRVNDLAAVFTFVGHGTSRDGFNAEWRGVTLMTTDNELLSRMEVFDEADLGTALAKFHQLSRPSPRLENAASRVADRFSVYYAAGDWRAMAEVLADNYSSDDRRRVVGSGIRHGREAHLEDMRARAELWLMNRKSTVMATRGERLALVRLGLSSRDQGSEAFVTELLIVNEINADLRLVGGVAFELDDLDAAFAELEARYMAGEAACFADTWSVITGVFIAHNRREIAAATPDVVSLDHRRGAAFAPGEGIEYILAGWDLDQTLNIYVETVHRANALGAVFTWVGYGASHEGFDAEWRGINLMTVDGEMLSRAEVFDEDDLDAALAKFDELRSRAPQRLEDAVAERFLAHFAARDWDAIAQDFADNYYCDDRRRVVNAGLRDGRDAAIEDLRVANEVGALTNITLEIIATRGERLILTHWQALGPDPEAVQTHALQVLEHDTDGRIAACVVFDLADIDAAFDELDAQYLAGEAAAHADTWSVVAKSCALFNQHELPATTPNSVYVDHRRVITVEAADLPAYLRGVWALTPDIRIYTEAVHRLSNDGAVVTHAVRGTSPEGFNAEWRMIDILTVEGNRLSRCEVFDESDLNAALARFDQLSPPAPRLKNAASQMLERVFACFAARDWIALAELVAQDICSEDRRSVVNAGIRHGRDAEIADMRAIADVGVKNITVTPAATRGERLTLSRVLLPVEDQGPDSFRNEALCLVELNADNRVAARLLFDVDDIDAAFEELDARYLVGEAAPDSHTWSVIAAIYAAFNRHELPAADWVTVDHRRGTPFASNTMLASIRAIWDLTPDLSIHIEAVHRLTKRGAVITHAQHGTSAEGFDAEWRQIQLLTVKGDRIDRCEIFDEGALDAALERFELLSRPAPQVKNTASQTYERILQCFATRDYDTARDILADDYLKDDRRRVVNSGRYGRDEEIANMKAIANVGVEAWQLSAAATRGDRLVLVRERWSGRDQSPEAFHTEVLEIVAIDSDRRICALITFDLDDIGAAFEELDARYLAGEAAAHAHTWSLMTQTHATLNGHEIPPTTPGWANIDHRRGVAFAPGDIVPYTRDTFDSTADVSFHIVAVHRLSDLGAVITQAIHGTSQEGFDAEWQNIGIFTFEGDLANRCEIFDETDMDAALARFEELHPRPRQLGNAASRVEQRFSAYFATRNWEAIAGLIATDFSMDDRRQPINAGVRHGRDAEIASLRAIADVGVTGMTMSTLIAIRGERLALGSYCVSDSFGGTNALCVLEINAENQIVARVGFDPNDLAAAVDELDARYLAGEAAAHAQTWSVITRECAAFNRHEVTAADYVTIDHRPLPIVEAFSQAALRVWDVTPDFGIHIETVHRLSGFGAVASYEANGTSPEGFDGKWRFILLLTVEGDRIDHCEVFDEADLDTALARFDKLHPQARRLENAASQAFERLMARWLARDWDAVAEMLADDVFNDDRRRVVNAGLRQGRDATIESMRASAAFGLSTVTSSVIATRGERLALSRDRFSIRDEQSEEVIAEVLGIVEIDVHERIVTRFAFELDDFDAAIAELDARYLASEAAPYAKTWSVIAGIQAAVNRRELPATTPNPGYIDHRPLVSIEGADLAASIRAVFDIYPAYRVYVEAVHRLDELGAVYTQAHTGTSIDGVDTELRMIEVQTVEGDLLSRAEVFDEADLDAAVARFDELHPQAPRLENTAARVNERFSQYFVLRDWVAVAQIFANNIVYDDRRRVVNGGSWQGRDLVIENMQAITDFKIENLGIIAIRGERLCLSRWRWSNSDPVPETFHTEVLCLVEVDTDELISGLFVFDPEDVDAAFEELEARYLAGEAAVHFQAWSAITKSYAAVNRHEMPPTTPDWVNADHRRAIGFAPGDLKAYLRTTFDVLLPDIHVHVEIVHRLSDYGAVVTRFGRGTSSEGFLAEWREIGLSTVRGDRIERSEMFDETDLDDALARFDELRPETRRLENTASRSDDRFFAHTRARNWAAATEILAVDSVVDDRRRVVNIGAWEGRDVIIANIRALAESLADVTSTAIAIRGERLALTRICAPNRDLHQGDFGVEMLCVTELDADDRITAHIMFDVDDLDAAFEELDGRYLAGEASAHAHTWSVIANGYATLNRHEIPPTTPDFVNIDHRRGRAFEPGDMIPYMHATFGVASDIKGQVEVVHRLSDLGVVVTHAFCGTSEAGFNFEWREITLLTVDGDRVNRGEMFDEVDLDAALARFDELDRPVPLLENASTRTWVRLVDAYNRRDMSGFLALMTEGARLDDRRKGLRGIHDGLALWKNVQQLFQAASNWRSGMEVIATRGSQLSLTRHRVRDIDETDQPIMWEALSVMEVGDDNLMKETISFDPDDIDAALEELDARYLAGEAAAYQHTWAVIAQAYAALRRGDLPATTADCVNIDHRRGIAFDGDVISYIRAAWDVAPDVKGYIEAVHRLTNLGALVAWASRGTSQAGFNAEWRGLNILTVNGDLINHGEIFEDTDLDAALARFDELDRPSLTQT